MFQSVSLEFKNKQKRIKYLLVLQIKKRNNILESTITSEKDFHTTVKVDFNTLFLIEIYKMSRHKNIKSFVNI